MGANKTSILKKCGELLIHIKKIKCKTKSYTFHCAFCSTDCDQLKKFTKHLEEEHLQNLEDDFQNEPEQIEPECSNPSFDPDDIKIERKMYIVDEISDNTIIVDKSMCLNVYNDPLKTEKHETKLCSNNISNDPLKTEKSDSNLSNEIDLDAKVNSNCIEVESYNEADISREEIDNEDLENSANCSDNTDENELNTKKLKKMPKTPKKSYTSDISTDDSNDSDFDMEKELHRSKKGKISKKHKQQTKNQKDSQTELIEDNHNTTNKETIEDNEKISLGTNNLETDSKEKKDCNIIRKHMRCKRRWKNIDQSKLPVLIEMYKKHEVLWKVNDIAFGILPKRNEIFGKMIEELNSSYNFDKNLDELQDHIDYINYIFHKDREHELKCELDKTEFKPSSKFYKELSFLSESQGPFKCSNCKEIIKKYDMYHIHLAQHNGTIPFQCRLCEMGFQKFDNYLRHITRHLGINSYHCNVCGKGYPFKSELDWHLTSHTGVKPYLCPICGASFRARHGYDNHIRRHEKRFRYECHICKHGFNHLCKLNTHIKSHLNIRDVICNVCGKGFTAAKYLHRHKLIHEEEKRYKCNVCGKAFAQDSGLRAHRKQHQPYSTIAENKNLLNVFK